MPPSRGEVPCRKPALTLGMHTFEELTQDVRTDTDGTLDG